MEGMNPGSAGIPQKLLFGSDYPYRDAERELGVEYGGAGLRASLALGGLSTVWGSAMLPYRQADITDWPITTQVLEPHYRAAVALTGLAAERDGLAELFPLFLDDPARLELSRQAKAMASAMAGNLAVLRANGIHHGRARVAIQGAGSAGGCVHCGLCMYGCAYGCIYNSATTVTRWATNPNFKYQPDVVVDSVAESSGSASVRGHRRGTDEPLEFEVDRVYLAAGVVATTGVLLRSLVHRNSPVFLKDSQYFLLPALLMKRVCGVRSEPLHALSQLFVELLDATISPHTVHLQLYTYNDLIGRSVQNMLGPLKRPLDFLARELEGRLVLFQGFVHSADSSQIAVTLTAADKLELKPVINPRARETVGKVVRKLLRNSPRLGAVPLPMMLQFAAPGRSFHAGGSFPMRANPNALETDTLGRPGGWKRIHAVDATVFPSVAATTITFTAMANAHRIATETCRQ